LQYEELLSDHSLNVSVHYLSNEAMSTIPISGHVKGSLATAISAGNSTAWSMFSTQYNLFNDEIVQGSGQNMFILRHGVKHLFDYHTITWEIINKVFDDIYHLPDDQIVRMPRGKPFQVTTENMVPFPGDDVRTMKLVDDDEPYKIAKRSWAINHVYPISFALASSNFVALDDISKQQKIREWALLVPGKKETYIYDTEESYKNGYRESWKARTKTKAGDDCFRHLEIIANGAIPIFEKIRETKSGTMFAYPKRLLAHFECPQTY